jgi:hypothetical protein
MSFEDYMIEDGFSNHEDYLHHLQNRARNAMEFSDYNDYEPETNEEPLELDNTEEDNSSVEEKYIEKLVKEYSLDPLSIHDILTPIEKDLFILGDELKSKENKDNLLQYCTRIHEISIKKEPQTNQYILIVLIYYINDNAKRVPEVMRVMELGKFKGIKNNHSIVFIKDNAKRTISFSRNEYVVKTETFDNKKG